MAAAKRDNLSGVGRTHLEREVLAHRAMWDRLRAVVAARHKAKAVAEESKQLPPMQTQPYLRVSDERLQAFKDAVEANGRTIDTVEEILGEWPAFQKSR